MAVRIVESADVSADAQIGDGTSVWHLAQVREGARLGENCVVGRGAYVGTGVRMGDNCKLQNYALVYEPAVLEDGVFVGPAVVFTNDHYPRAVTPDGALKRGDDWEAVLAAWGKNIPLGRVGRPEDIAQAILFLASDESSWITGTTLVVDGGATMTHPPIG